MVYTYFIFNIHSLVSASCFHHPSYCYLDNNTQKYVSIHITGYGVLCPGVYIWVMC